MPVIDYEARRDWALKRLMDDSQVSDKNKNTLQQYLAAGRQKVPTQYRLLPNLRIVLSQWDDILETFDFTVTQAEVEKLKKKKGISERAAYEQAVKALKDKKRAQVNKVFNELLEKHRPGTFEELRKAGLALVRYFNDDETPYSWKDIRRMGKNGNKFRLRPLKPADMWTWDDVKALANHTNSVQIKAILYTLLDAGLRPSEFIDLNFGDVKILDQYGVIEVRDGKTGARTVHVLKCVPRLQQWLKNHPTKEDDSPLWMMESAKHSHKKDSKDKSLRYQYPALLKRLRVLAKRAKVSKPTDFYTFRHSSCTLAKIECLDVSVSAAKYGHSTEYFTKVYGRLDERGELQRFKSAMGDIGEEEQKLLVKPQLCQKCGTVNESEAQDCVSCGGPLTIDRALKKTEDYDALQKRLNEQEQRMAKMDKYMQAFQMLLHQKNIKVNDIFEGGLK